MTDRQTDGRTDRRTDGGDCNIPDAFLKKRGDKYTIFKIVLLHLLKVYLYENQQET